MDSSRWFPLSFLSSTTISPVSSSVLRQPAHPSLSSLTTIPEYPSKPFCGFSFPHSLIHSFVSVICTQKHSARQPQWPHQAGIYISESNYPSWPPSQCLHCHPQPNNFLQVLLLQSKLHSLETPNSCVRPSDPWLFPPCLSGQLGLNATYW